MIYCLKSHACKTTVFLRSHHKDVKSTGFIKVYRRLDTYRTRASVPAPRTPNTQATTWQCESVTETDRTVLCATQSANIFVPRFVHLWHEHLLSQNVRWLHLLSKKKYYSLQRLCNRSGSGGSNGQFFLYCEKVNSSRHKLRYLL